ncbi:MAG: hypothetical protein JWP27_405 [Flaviaesturariibacter sp.]|nr:hypothetical protein [Flaviaesturariibacter sp.]
MRPVAIIRFCFFAALVPGLFGDCMAQDTAHHPAAASPMPLPAAYGAVFRSCLPKSESRFFATVDRWFRLNAPVRTRKDSSAGLVPAGCFCIGHLIGIVKGHLALSPVFLSNGDTTNGSLVSLPRLKAGDGKSPGILTSRAEDIELDADDTTTAGAQQATEVGLMLRWLVESIVRGRLPVSDIGTGQRIPAQRLLSWRQGTDTLMTMDAQGRTSIKLRKRALDVRAVTRLRMRVSWTFDPGTGRLSATLLSAVLLVKKDAGEGWPVGLEPFARIAIQ